MIKQLLFSLLITSTALQSMELTVLHNHDILSHITSQICNVHNWDAKKIKRTIQTLAKTDKTLYTYYTHEKTQQNIVRQVALHKKLSDSMIARYFDYVTIMNNINALFSKLSITPEKLTQEDLLDKWYLNSTIPCGHFNEGDQETLLLQAIRKFGIITAQQLITAGIDCNFTRNNNPFFFINHYYSQTDIELQLSEDKRQIFFDIIELLLKKNLHPDTRFCITNDTLLHQASFRNDQRLARLLLQYGADPYLTCDDNDNAFTVETGSPRGWLTAIVNEIERGKKNS